MPLAAKVFKSNFKGGKAVAEPPERASAKPIFMCSYDGCPCNCNVIVDVIDGFPCQRLTRHLTMQSP
jgi:hypothetical protein